MNATTIVIAVVVAVVALAAGKAAGFFVGFNDRTNTPDSQIGSA